MTSDHKSPTHVLPTSHFFCRNAQQEEKEEQEELATDPVSPHDHITILYRPLQAMSRYVSHPYILKTRRSMDHFCATL